ncbi:MAG: hypothetical protein H6559_35685 [Lewinellaceae bacterium]|nr:hypothetical protein [Lewinellaceae bacterium]
MLPGATFPDCLELLEQRATARHLLPYSQDCAPIPENRHHARARANRIKGYRKVFSLSTVWMKRSKASWMR